MYKNDDTLVLWQLLNNSGEPTTHSMKKIYSLVVTTISMVIVQTAFWDSALFLTMWSWRNLTPCHSVSQFIQLFGHNLLRWTMTNQPTNHEVTSLAVWHTVLCLTVHNMTSSWVQKQKTASHCLIEHSKLQTSAESSSLPQSVLPTSGSFSRIQLSASLASAKYCWASSESSRSSRRLLALSCTQHHIILYKTDCSGTSSPTHYLWRVYYARRQKVEQDNADTTQNTTTIQQERVRAIALWHSP